MRSCYSVLSTHNAFSIVFMVSVISSRSRLSSFRAMVILIWLLKNMPVTKNSQERNSWLTSTVLSSVYIIVKLISISHNSTGYYTKLFLFWPLLLGIIPIFVLQIISVQMILFSELTRVATFHFLIIHEWKSRANCGPKSLNVSKVVFTVTQKMLALEKPWRWTFIYIFFLNISKIWRFKLSV